MKCQWLATMSPFSYYYIFHIIILKENSKISIEIKRREVCQLVREKQHFILCIQKTKLPVFDVTVCNSI